MEEIEHEKNCTTIHIIYIFSQLCCTFPTLDSRGCYPNEEDGLYYRDGKPCKYINREIMKERKRDMKE